jgi:hypothetical protein
MPAFVMAKCPVCEQLQPHTTVGAEKDEDGRDYQRMICNVCKTSNKVYTGEDGEHFQRNYDTPDNTDLSELE